MPAAVARAQDQKDIKSRKIKEEVGCAQGAARATASVRPVEHACVCASAPLSLGNAVAMTHVAYAARFASSREPYQRLYVGMTHKPELRPAELGDRSHGQQPKFCRPMQGALQFDIVYRGLSKATAKVLEAQVAAKLYAKLY